MALKFTSKETAPTIGNDAGYSSFPAVLPVTKPVKRPGYVEDKQGNRTMVNMPKPKNVRKPTGRAKAAVTLRLSKDCVLAYVSKHGDDWRAQMQARLETILTDP